MVIVRRRAGRGAGADRLESAAAVAQHRKTLRRRHRREGQLDARSVGRAVAARDLAAQRFKGSTAPAAKIAVNTT